MGTSSIVDLIFDLHRDFINPNIIARRQVTRLIDRLIAKVGPELIANRKYEDKENAASNAAAATPAKQMPTPLETAKPAADRVGNSFERKNLALQLGQAR